MFDIYEKEIDLLCLKSTHEMECIESVILLQEAGENKFLKFIKMVMTKIKDFFIKIKKKISEMYAEAKCRAMLKYLKDVIIDEQSKNLNPTMDFDLGADAVRARLLTFYVDSQKILKKIGKQKNDALVYKFNQLYKQACNDIDIYMSASNGDERKKKSFKKKTMREAATMAIQNIKNINPELDEIHSKFNKMIKSYNGDSSIFNEKKEEIARGETETGDKVAITVVNKSKTLTERVVGFLAKHPFIVAGAVCAAGAAIYKKGYENGYGTGHSTGKEVGWRKGMKAGEEKGLELGRKEGRLSGFIKGKEVGMNIGSENGRKLGRREGELIGQKKGFNDGRELGRKEGLLAGQRKKEKAYREGHKNGENAGMIKAIGSVMNSIERNKKQSSSSVKKIETANNRSSGVVSKIGNLITTSNKSNKNSNVNKKKGMK